MSMTVSTPQMIHNSPLNQSTAKQLYSFPKAGRFSGKRTEGCDQFYQLPNMKQTRAAAIGYGQKYDLTKSASQAPAPNTYQMKSEIELQKEKHLGWTIGVGREKMTQSGIFAGEAEKVPGPGRYNLKSTLSSIKFTMRPKPLLRSTSELQNVPGPGSYSSVPGINEKARYPISKFKSYGTTVFNPVSSQRFVKEFKSEAPGPGAYPIKPSIDKEGRYFNSKFSSSRVRSFPHAQRKTFENTKTTPGPGNYRLPSEFGYYESAKSQQKFN